MERFDAQERSVIRWGGFSAIAATLIAIVGNALHPRVAADDIGDTEAYLRLVDDSGAWVAVHVAIIGGSLLFLLAQYGLSRALIGTPGESLGRAGLAFAVLGGAVNLVDLLIDGSVMPALAAGFSSVDEGRRVAVLEAARVMQLADFGLLSGIMLAFFGVPFLLYGLAVAASGRFPRALGLVAAVIGTISVITGLWQAADGVSALTYLYAFPPVAALLSAWIGLLGWLQLRMLKESPSVASLVTAGAR